MRAVTEGFLTSARKVWGGIAAAALGAVFMFAGSAATAQQTTVVGENYTPTIWVDPDGCEHWVMDDGWEGYMTPHVTR